MKYEIGVMMFYEIDAPEISDEEWENGETDKICETFWEKYHNNELGQGEACEIGCIEFKGKYIQN